MAKAKKRVKKSAPKKVSSNSLIKYESGTFLIFLLFVVVVSMILATRIMDTTTTNNKNIKNVPDSYFIKEFDDTFLGADFLTLFLAFAIQYHLRKYYAHRSEERRVGKEFR